MAQLKTTTAYHHGPDNAAHEIRKAYNSVIEASAYCTGEASEPEGVNPQELLEIYEHAFECYKKGKRLAAERWARTAKHLARAFMHESKIAYLAPRTQDLPFLIGAQDDEYGLHERSDTTTDLLGCVANRLPTGPQAYLDEMKKYLSRAREHLKILEMSENEHELLRAERINTAHEYGRALECIFLGLEAESNDKKAVA